MKHSLGPFRAGATRSCEAEILDARGCEVARVVAPVAPGRGVDPCDLQDANLALLCAAPDLLEACEYAYSAAAIEWHRCGGASPSTPSSALMDVLAGPISRARGLANGSAAGSSAENAESIAEAAKAYRLGAAMATMLRRLREACEMARHHVSMEQESIGRTRTLDALNAALGGAA